MEDQKRGTNLPAGLWPVTAGGGVVRTADGVVRLDRLASPTSAYVNAQVSDPGPLKRRPPLRARLRARFGQAADQFHGTAGFGFWNAALNPSAGLPAAPRAAWFFLGGSEFEVPLVLDVPGNGFKAAVLDARRWAVYALLPAAPVGFVLLRHPALYRRLWPLAQRALRAAEQPLADVDITSWHTYEIVWERDSVRFAVDDVAILHAKAPGGPLEFVAWIDNAFAVATPRGRFALGTVATVKGASLEIADLAITSGAKEYGAGPGGPAP